MTYLARAMNSGDLSHKETRCDTDTLQATAGASKASALGVMLKEALEGAAGDSRASATRVTELHDPVARMVVNQSNKLKLKVPALPVAKQLVHEFLFNVCLRCQGRKFLPLSYGDGATDEIAGADCPTCFGSGKGAPDRVARANVLGVPYAGDAAELCDRVLARMEWEFHEAERDIKRRLK